MMKKDKILWGAVVFEILMALPDRFAANNILAELLRFGFSKILGNF